MRLIFDAQNAARNHRFTNCQFEPCLCFITVGNRWTKLFMRLKGLNGESALNPLIDLFEVLSSHGIQTRFARTSQVKETCAPDKSEITIRLCRPATRAGSSE